MDEIQCLEKRKTLLGIKRRLLQLDLEELEVEKQLSLLRGNTQASPASAQLSGEERRNIDSLIAPDPKRQRLIFDLTANKLDYDIKAKPEDSVNSNILKEGLISQSSDGLQIDDHTTKDSLRPRLKPRTEASSSFQDSTREVPDQHKTDHDAEMSSSADATEPDDQPEDAGEVVANTSTLEIVTTQGDSAERSHSATLAMEGVRPGSQCDKSFKSATSGPLFFPAPPISVSSQMESDLKRTTAPAVKQGADEMSQSPANAKMESREIEGTQAVGSEPRDTGHEEPYAGDDLDPPEIICEKNNLIAVFCWHGIRHVLSETSLPSERAQWSSILERVRPSLQARKFDTVEEFGMELRDVARTTGAEFLFTRAVSSLEEEWKGYWNLGKWKKTHAKRKKLACRWYRC